MDLGVRGKRAFVAAASRGLGRACAEELGREGVDVAICSRTQETLDEVAEAIRSESAVRAISVAADLEKADEVSRAIREAEDALGGLDILIVNVGGPPIGGFDDMDDDDWQKAFEQVHLSAVRLIRAVLPGMRERAWGRIVAIQSSSVKQPIDRLILSNGIRPGVAGVFKTLANDVARDNVTLNIVLPGMILTDRIVTGQTARAKDSGITLEEQLRRTGEFIPMRRIGEPREVAYAVTFLASEPASYITGAVLQVDGGSIRSVI